jgi:hypothetical protein
MTFVPADDVVQANLRFTLLDQKIENTLYFYYAPTSVSVAAMQQLGLDLISWWGTNVAPELVDDIFMREVYLTDLSTQTGPTASVVPGNNIIGGYSSDPVPNNVALCVSFRTNGRGRSARGRNYISGFSETQLSGNTMDTAIADNIRAAYELLLDPITFTDDWLWVVLSRFANGNPRAQGLVQPVETAVLTDYTVDSQRRRLPGRGR